MRENDFNGDGIVLIMPKTDIHVTIDVEIDKRIIKECNDLISYSRYVNRILEILLSPNHPIALEIEQYRKENKRENLLPLVEELLEFALYKKKRG